MIKLTCSDNDRTLVYCYHSFEMKFDFIKIEQTEREVRVSYMFPFLGLFLKWIQLDDVSPFHVTVQGWDKERIDIEMNCTLTFTSAKFDALIAYLEQIEEGCLLNICIDLEDLLLYYEQTVRSLQERVGAFQRLVLLK